MSDKEFDEWLRSTRPRPGAGAYPALPMDFSGQKPTKSKRKVGRPKRDEQRVLEILPQLKGRGLNREEQYIEAATILVKKYPTLNPGNLKRWYSAAFIAFDFD